MKQNLIQQQQQIQAAHTTLVRQSSSKLRERSGIGHLARTAQPINEDADRQLLAQELACIEQRQQAVEAMTHAIDHALLQIENFMIETSSLIEG